MSRDTARSRRICTRRAFSRRSNAALMSKALSLTGNTRFPRSVFSGTPKPSKKAMASELEKRLKAP